VSAAGNLEDFKSSDLALPRDLIVDNEDLALTASRDLYAIVNGSGGSGGRQSQ
jgi:hypothetical protein